MSEKFHTDELDAVSGIGGRHRKVPTAATRLAQLGTFVASSAALAAIGFFGLSAFSSLSQVNGTVPPGSAVIAGFKSDGIPVTVIDATGGYGQATKVAAILAGRNWNVLSAVRNQADDAGNVKMPKSVVYANATAALPAAREIAADLGSLPVKRVATYPDAVTVILGQDFK